MVYISILTVKVKACVILDVWCDYFLVQTRIIHDSNRVSSFRQICTSGAGFVTVDTYTAGLNRELSIPLFVKKNPASARVLPLDVVKPSDVNTYLQGLNQSNTLLNRYLQAARLK